MTKMSANSAYVIAIALGDGNLSNPNGRAVRLRVFCDNKYPKLIERIKEALSKEFPFNKVSTQPTHGNCSVVSVYSNELESLLGWRAKNGSKHAQKVRVPGWIFSNHTLIKKCLKGLIETDGSIYNDRGYVFINFTTMIHGLSQDFQIMCNLIGYECDTQIQFQKTGSTRFTSRISKSSDAFISDLCLDKS